MKRILSYLGVALLFLLMQGCASRTPPASTVTTYANDKENTNPKLSKLVGKNYIKGVVISLKQDVNAQAWNYEIDGIETTNGKLPYVNFNHKAVLANEGDLVYASFDGMRVSEMFVIKAAYFKNGKIAPSPVYTKKKSSTPDTSGKRDKAHQVLGVPKEESIKLN